MADAAGSDGYANAVTGLQRGLNMLNVSNPLPKRSPAYGPYTGLDPVDEDGKYGPQTDFAFSDNQPISMGWAFSGLDGARRK